MKLNDTSAPATGEAVTSTSTFPMSREWMESHWMAFTGNRDFKAKPRMMVSAQGAYFTDSNGKKIFERPFRSVVRGSRPRPSRDY